VSMVVALSTAATSPAQAVKRRATSGRKTVRAHDFTPGKQAPATTKKPTPKTEIQTR
jgi:hypothetical protein